MKREQSTCAMCEFWTLTQPGADAKQGNGHCKRFQNEIEPGPRPAAWDEVQCVVFERAREVGDRERYVAKMNERAAK